MKYSFLVDTYDTERIKILSVWSEFRDEDMRVRPREDDARGRSVHEQMVHQCVSEDAWFRIMLGIDVGAPPLPESETRLMFIKRYREDSGKRVAALRATADDWWEQTRPFFDVSRSRAWIMTRRLNHTSHHRGQLIISFQARKAVHVVLQVAVATVIGEQDPVGKLGEARGLDGEAVLGIPKQAG